MKFAIFLLALLFICGCFDTKPSEDVGFFGAHPSETLPPLEGPKFRFGDAVFVDQGFYKGCQGNVTEYRRSLHGFDYTVNAKCASVDGKYTENKIVVINERDLVTDGSR